MKREAALKIIDETTVDYTQTNSVLRGLQILSRYVYMNPSFEHDQMWAAGFDMTVDKMTREEVIEIARLGWFESENSWSHY